ncbi:MAG: hypothetical protein ACSLE9_13315 [Burkholderiaceae bacterium]
MLLFALAAGAAGLAALGERASAAVHRERERELIFRGSAIAEAIASYWSASPGDTKTLPHALEELVEDRRGPRVLRHLRRVYVDPFTGRADWLVIGSEDGRIAGVRSRSDALAMRTFDLPALPADRPARVSDRAFVFSPERPAPASTAPVSIDRPAERLTRNPLIDLAASDPNSPIGSWRQACRLELSSRVYTLAVWRSVNKC